MKAERVKFTETTGSKGYRVTLTLTLCVESPGTEVADVTGGDLSITTRCADGPRRTYAGLSLTGRGLSKVGMDEVVACAESLTGIGLRRTFEALWVNAEAEVLLPTTPIYTGDM